VQSTRQIRVGILGATGVVGQRIAALLNGHPHLKLEFLAASEDRTGTIYHAGVKDKLFVEPSRLDPFYDKKLEAPFPRPGIDLVFSALSADAATKYEPLFAEAGIAVSTNASAFRMDPLVPVIICDVNPEHLSVLPRQKEAKGWKGFIVANSNCSTSGLVTALAPLMKWGIRSVSVCTYQSLSGAGWPGHPALAALGNVIPFIPMEEEKMVEETKKILGGCTSEGFHPASMTVDAACARVPVAEGHLLAATVHFEGEPAREEIISAWRAMPSCGLYSAPRHPIVYCDEPDRPQPRLDVGTENGMSVIIGRLRRTDSGGWAFFALANNLARGAAGAAVTNGELLWSRGLV